MAVGKETSAGEETVTRLSIAYRCFRQELLWRFNGPLEDHVITRQERNGPNSECGTHVFGDSLSPIVAKVEGSRIASLSGVSTFHLLAPTRPSHPVICLSDFCKHLNLNLFYIYFYFSYLSSIYLSFQPFTCKFPQRIQYHQPGYWSTPFRSPLTRPTFPIALHCCPPPLHLILFSYLSPRDSYIHTRNSD